jgi:hypothetical protein
LDGVLSVCFKLTGWVDSFASATESEGIEVITLAGLSILYFRLEESLLCRVGVRGGLELSGGRLKNSS